MADNLKNQTNMKAKVLRYRTHCQNVVEKHDLRLKYPQWKCVFLFFFVFVHMAHHVKLQILHLKAPFNLI